MTCEVAAPFCNSTIECASGRGRAVIHGRRWSATQSPGSERLTSCARPTVARVVERFSVYNALCRAAAKDIQYRGDRLGGERLDRRRRQAGDVRGENDIGQFEQR